MRESQGRTDVKRIAPEDIGMSSWTREHRAKVIAEHGTIRRAVAEAGALPQFQDLTLAEAIVLGLYNQGVRKYVGVLGHGNTDIAEVLRTYASYGLVKMINVRHETVAAHAATALKMQTGETAAVLASIGPGALHACAGALCAAANGAGVYHIYADETSHDEGFNMQQIPKDEQGLFLKMCSVMGEAYVLWEPCAVFAALRRGAVRVGGRSFNGPFFLLAPMNVQPALIRNCNLLEFPEAFQPPPLECNAEEPYLSATELAIAAERITIKLGAGSKGCGPEIVTLARLLDAAIVSGPNATGIVPYDEPRYMTVGGSKGSLCGNYAMNEADLVVIVGARAVCQWDSSGTAWKKAKHIVNFNVVPQHAAHYNRTIAVPGDAKSNLARWIEILKTHGVKPADGASAWAKAISARKAEWEAFKTKRYECPPLMDEAWGRPVLSQPAALKVACDFADSVGAIKYFDAGDVQANGFQIVEDKHEGQTCTDTGASYMGFAASALLAGALREGSQYGMAFSGDGSFTMNPQILIDGAAHGVKGCVLVFDNRRMAAISGLQRDHYGRDFATNDSVAVDYVAWANAVPGVKGAFGGTSVEELRKALNEAYAHEGLSLVHIPVYYGSDERASMGVFGDWNVGPWSERVQAEHHRIGL